jgi:hypothetical protein
VPFTLVSTAGEASPELPPVLTHNCRKLSFEQLLDHFPGGAAAGAGGGAGADGSSADTEHARHVPHGSGAAGSDAAAAPAAAGEAPATAAAAAAAAGPKTFKQVYWVCDGTWPKAASAAEQAASSSLLVFLGNESPLGVPSQPIVFESARRLGALVLLVEHRYYGVCVCVCVCARSHACCLLVWWCVVVSVCLSVCLSVCARANCASIGAMPCRTLVGLAGDSLPFEVPQGGSLPTANYKWLTMQQVGVLLRVCALAPRECLRACACGACRGVACL